MPANATANTSLLGFYEIVSQNPMMLVIISIQFILGLIAGYFTAKIAKYVIGLLAVFILGAVLGVWGTANSVNDAIKRLGALAEVKDVAYRLAQVFGFMAVGPTFIGFMVGILIGVARK